jgi:hypothetical protein
LASIGVIAGAKDGGLDGLGAVVSLKRRPSESTCCSYRP